MGYMGFPGSAVVKNLPSNAGDARDRHGFDPWVREIPWSRNGNLLQYLWPENSVNKGAWGYSPLGCKELEMTAWLSTHACCGLYASLDFLQYCTVSVIFIFIFNVLFCIGALVFSHVLYSWSLLVIHFKYMLVTFEFYKLVTAYQTTDVKSQCIAKDPNAGKDWRQGWRGWQRMK